MLLQSELTPPPHESDREPRATLCANLPGDPILTERAAALLRNYLRAHGLDGYQIYFCSDLDYYGIEKHLEQLGERGASWSQAPPLSGAGQPVAALTFTDEGAKRWDAGFLRLSHHRVVLARWYWRNGHDALSTLWLCAARSHHDVHALKQDVRRCQDASPPVWHILRGGAYTEEDPVPRDRGAGEGLILPQALRDRLQAEVISFFSEDVVALYRSLNVPHRRGVLLHGPPGNGKTSIIRWIGAAVPRAHGMILRPESSFDSDDLETVVDRWISQSPSILVIEDLNWLLKKVELSLFLNLVDGVEQRAKAGALLIATTNHPHELDPAVNNRPGRFDVVIEVPCPDHASRLDFLNRRLPEVAEPVRAKLAALSDGFSFAHLHELLRLSGLRAIHEGRPHRSDGDLLDAVNMLRATMDDAVRGFPAKLELPFGLHHVRAVRQAVELD